MRTNIICAIFALAFIICGCGSSKKSPIKTFVMPCSEYKSGDGVLRAWAVGVSDSKTSARKKAQMTASADLAASLSNTIKNTTEKYITSLGEGNLKNETKSFLNNQIKSIVNQTITGATIVCDQWTEDKATGQFSNYIAMEIKGEDYMNLLYEEISKNQNIAIDKNLLNKLFLENIGKSAD